MEAPDYPSSTHSSVKSNLARSSEESYKKKKIIVCCDGTSCTTYRGDNKSPPTNVARIARCIKAVSRHGIPQVVHYIPGVGTGEESDWNPLHLYNLGTGRGVQEKIMEGYSFICHNYTTPEDEIILIGFSRGGFIIRCIADIVYRVGVLTKFGLYYLRDVYDMWRRAGESRRGSMEEVFGEPPGNGSGVSTTPRARWEDNWPMLGDPILPEHEYPENLDEYSEDFAFEFNLGNDDDGNFDLPTTPVASITSDNSKCGIEVRLGREELSKCIRNGNEKIIRRGVRVEVCAAWDSVGALGPLSPRLCIFRPWQFRKLGFIRSDLHPGVNNAFQALSLHDRRRSFLPIVWSRPSPAGEAHSTSGTENSRLEQCWFMGYHGDIGGGRYGEGLAHFSLAWMLGKLRRFVDMDASNFWSPRLSCSNWSMVKDGERKASLRIQLRDTLTPLFWLGGADCRKPRRQFWTKDGFRELPVDRNVSGEFMHFTVQLLVKEKAMRKCKCLRHVQVPGRSPDSRVIWQLPILTRPGWSSLARRFRKLLKPEAALSNVYPVNEVPMSREHGCRYPELASELVLLKQWYDSELEVLQSNSNSTKSKPKPASSIPQAKAMLDSFVDDIIVDLNQEMTQHGLTEEDMRDVIDHDLWGF